MPDLTGLSALDVAIGLSFIFLLLSLLASAIQEFIAGIFGLRARTLERGLRNMLQGGDGSVLPGGAAPGPAGTLVDAVYLHPLIRPLYKAGFGLGARRDGRRLPSYIAPRSFALALLDTLAPDVVGTNADGTPKPSHDVLHETRTAIAGASLPPEVERRILALLDDARGDIDAFRHNLEAWFDDTMARVSGWYKRKTQIILLVIGVVVAIAINANTLTMGSDCGRTPLCAEPSSGRRRASVIRHEPRGISIPPRTRSTAWSSSECRWAGRRTRTTRGTSASDPCATRRTRFSGGR